MDSKDGVEDLDEDKGQSSGNNSGKAKIIVLNMTIVPPKDITWNIIEWECLQLVSIPIATILAIIWW